MTVFNDDIDIHHVFPKRWCELNGRKPATYNSIINKTPLSRASNQIIGGDAPSKYLVRIEKIKGISSNQLDDILRTHLIEPSYLRADDFDGFYSARKAALASLAGDAQGKLVIREPAAEEETVPEFPHYDNELESAEAA